ncbi:hypothetical protein C6A85_89430 [Mycobacterium sp. ITM-2017-0098]|nr:hypothetical protein C6A85_89430 [Mycobacterium sp. ITM-2017-0098]
MGVTLHAFEILPEATLRDMVDLMVRLIEACGAVVIMIGAIVAITKFVIALGRRDINQFSAVRLSLARFLVLGLEFQLAADVLRTAISPSFEEIGKLAAIATIRTVLNYFLNREIAQEQREIELLDTQRPAVPPPAP